MEVQYGIQTNNKYALFYDDSVDLSEILEGQDGSKKSEEKGKGKKDSRSEKDSKSAKNKQNKKVLTPVQEQKSRQIEQGSAERNGKER